jgi:hypothetical protein
VGSYHVVIRAKFLVRVLPIFLLPYLLFRNYKNRIELKFPKTTLSLCCFLHSYCLLKFWLHCWSSCWFLLSNPLEFQVLLMILVTISATSNTPIHHRHQQFCRLRYPPQADLLLLVQITTSSNLWLFSPNEGLAFSRKREVLILKSL